MAKKVMEVRDVYKSYGDEVKTEVLHGLSFAMEENEFSSIIGPSGSGKSTLLNLIGALDYPTAGEIEINGTSLGSLNEDELADFRNQNLGFVFQFHHLLPEFTALENVLMPVWIEKGSPSSADREWAEELLETVGLYTYRNNLSTKLSGGQKQRVALARALMNRPGIVLADEPTGNLDTETSEQAYDLMRDINEQYGTVIIIVTHDRHLAGRTDRIIEIVDGKITRDIEGSPEDEFATWDDMAPSYCIEHQRVRSGKTH